MFGVNPCNFVWIITSVDIFQINH